MKFDILKLRVYKLFGYKNIELDFNPVTVLVGDNGTGKSTLLRIIHSLITLNESDALKLCEEAEIILSGDISIKYNNYHRYDSREILEKVFIDTINSNDFNYEKVDAKELMKLIQSNLDAHVKVRKRSNFRILHGRARITAASYMKQVENNANVEFISNVDLSANSRLNFTTMEGEDANMLDSYIKLEVNKISHVSRQLTRRILIREINKFLDSSEKSIRKLRGGIVVICEKAGNIPFQQLSAGEKQLLFIMLKVANTLPNDAIILMDEPEISLHLNWQERLIDSIRCINPAAQVIIVTHSPGIVMNGYRDAFRDMKNIEMDLE